MEIRSIIEMLLAIDCLLLSIVQYILSKRLRDLTNNVVYLTFKDLNKEEKEPAKTKRRKSKTKETTENRTGK